MQTSINILLFITTLIASCYADGGTVVWNYDRSDADEGPSGWYKGSSVCGGDRNSPIDIQTADVDAMEAEDWDLSGWDTAANYTVKDLDHAIKFDVDSATITTKGGGLGMKYRLLQFHFHWGQADSKGSEHTVNGNSYPMEVHLVHYDNSAASVDVALEDPQDDTLAVLGFFFEIQDNDNPDLEKIVDGVSMVRADADASVSGYELGALTDIISSTMDGSYYRYFGGLTTPGCSEIVQWTVFKTPIGISAAQMEVFRNQTPAGGEYYRPVVALGSRTVSYYDVDYSAASLNTALWSLSLLSVIAKFI